MKYLGSSIVMLMMILGLFGCAAETVRTLAAENEESNEDDKATFLKKVKKKNATYDEQN